MMLHHTVVAVVGALLISACAGLELAAQVEVPAVAPDSIPSTLLEDADLVEVSGGQRRSTSVLITLFHRTAKQAERQAAVDLVSGRVVGGIQSSVGDGLYLIRVPGDSTLATIDSIVAVLKSLPEIASVSTFSTGGSTVN